MAVTPFPIGIPADVTLNDVRSRAKALLRSAQAGENAALKRINRYFDDPEGHARRRPVTSRQRGRSARRTRLRVDRSSTRDRLGSRRTGRQFRLRMKWALPCLPGGRGRT